MPGLVVNLSGNSVAYDAMLAKSVVSARAAATQMSKAQVLPTLAAATATAAASQAQRAAMIGTAAAAAQVATNVGKATMGAHNLSAIIREVAVIFREIAMGRGAGRILGSATLLAQYTWKGFLTALVSIPGLVAVAGAAIGFFVYKHLQNLNAALDKTAKMMAESFGGDRQKANIDAMLESARAAGVLKDRLAELGKVHETLADQLDESLKKMDEEFQMMRKVAQVRGETPQQEIAAEQAMRKQQLALINETLEKQEKLAAAKKQELIDITASANDPNRSATVTSKRKELDKAIKTVEEMTPIVNQLGDIVNKKATTGGGVELNLSPQELARRRAELSSQMFTTKSGDRTTLDAASKILEDNNRRVNDLPKQIASLEENQREQLAAQSKASEAATREADAAITIKKKQKAISDEIGLHDKYDNALGLAKHGGRMEVTERERIGLGAASGVQISILEYTKQIATHNASAAADLKKITEYMKQNEGAFD